MIKVNLLIVLMFQVNCETDFVAKNTEFQQFVEEMLSGCMNYAATLKLEKDITKVSVCFLPFCHLLYYLLCV